MFWDFAETLSQLDSILDKENVTIEEVLNEDDVLQECKIQNKKLLDFFLVNENFAKLVGFICDDPSDEVDDDTKYKYSNLSCELLTAHVELLTDALIGSDNLYLNKLCSVLEKPAPLNPLMASFFMKVLLALISQRCQHVVSYFESKDDLITNILRHLGTSAIMDLLVKMGSNIDSKLVRAQLAQWLISERLIDRLVDGINETESDEKHYYTAFCLSELMNNYREQLASVDDDEPNSNPEVFVNIGQLLDNIESVETLKRLAKVMTSQPFKVSIIVSCTHIFNNILDKKSKENPFIADLNPLLVTPRVDPKRIVTATEHLVEALLPHIDCLMKILEEPPQQFFSKMQTTHGDLNPPLGSSRLQVIRLIQYLIDAGTFSIHKHIYESNMIQVILELFHKYPWNSFLHQTLEDIIKSIFSQPPPVSDTDKNISLIRQMVVDRKFLTILVDWWDENEVIRKTAGGVCRGYTGNLVNMASFINSSIEEGCNSELLAQLCKDLEPNDLKKWKAFVETPLAEELRKNIVDKHSLDNSGSFRDRILNTKFDGYSVESGVPDHISAFFRSDPGIEEEAFSFSVPPPRHHLYHTPQASKAEGTTVSPKKIEEDTVAKDDSDDEEDLASPVRICQSSSGGNALSTPLAGLYVPPDDDILCEPPTGEGWPSNDFDTKEEDNDFDFNTAIPLDRDSRFSLEDEVQPLSNEDPWAATTHPKDNTNFPENFAAFTTLFPAQSEPGWANFGGMNSSEESAVSLPVSSGAIWASLPADNTTSSLNNSLTLDSL